METYQIITDEEKLVEFIDWLPELGVDERFYVSLFSRSKYAKDIVGGTQLSHIRSDKAQMDRFLASKNTLLTKIKGLERKLGTYFQYTDNGKDNFSTTPVPQEALALYLVPNPRSGKEATFTLMEELLTVIKNQSWDCNIVSKAMSAMQKSNNKSSKYFVLFDFDVEDREEVLYKIINQDIINLDAVSCIKTRGGIHVIVHLKKIKSEYARTWYKALNALDGLDEKATNTKKNRPPNGGKRRDIKDVVNSQEEDLELQEEIDKLNDIAVPIPGTYQGGFTPVLIKSLVDYTPNYTPPINESI